MLTSPNLSLDYIDVNAAQREVVHNAAIRTLDALVQLAVLDRDLALPPGSPTDGARYIVAASPTGAWAGHAGHIAAWQDGAWHFYTPRVGFLADVADEGKLVVWNGSAWVDTSSLITALQNLALLGVGTTADATNPFSAKLNNTLWVAKTVAEGGDGNLRYTLSKENASKTLSCLFQDNFSGRAEVGLTGDDDFHFKVSSDGSTWVDALVLDKTTGAAKLNSGLFLTGDISPSQITADQNDYNPTGLAGASVLRLSSDASRSLTGLSGGSEGRVLTLLNVGSWPLILKDAHASSSAANRFAFGVDLALSAKQSALLWYDATDSRWTLMARASQRETLTADRTYYVRTDGSDSNNGLSNSSGGAFLTVQAAYNAILGIDLGGHVATIQLGDGTYTGALNITASPIGGNVVINGNGSTPANVVLSATSADAIFVSAPINLLLQNFEIRTTTSGNGINATVAGAFVRLGTGMRLGSCAGAQLRAYVQGYIKVEANLAIVGGAQRHALIPSGMLTYEGVTVTVTGTPAFSAAFVDARRCGVIVAQPGTTFSGAATGIRYTATMNAVIETAGGGASFFPGDSAGSTVTGGQYA